MARLSPEDIKAVAEATSKKVIAKMPHCSIGLTSQDAQEIKTLLTTLNDARKTAIKTIISIIVAGILGVIGWRSLS